MTVTVEVETQVCTACSQGWPSDRFISKSTECFRCRSKGISYSYGVGGKAAKQQFHDVTLKEFNDRQVREARANGLDPIPVHTATTAAPTGKMLADLKATSERITPPLAKGVAT